MIEMNHAEVAKNLEDLGKELAYQPATWKQMTIIQAAADEHKIANKELVEVVRCGECENKPFCECVINNDYEDEDFCSCGEKRIAQNENI